jgi:hypothetical protein
MQTNILILPSLPYVLVTSCLIGAFICGIMHASNRGEPKLWQVCLHHFQSSFVGTTRLAVCPLGVEASWYEPIDLSQHYSIVMSIALAFGFVLGLSMNYCANHFPGCRRFIACLFSCFWV